MAPIYSFDDVLRAKRSMHSIEALPGRRIPLPRSIPYVNALYFAGVVLAIMAVGKVAPLVDVVNAPLSVVAGDAKIAAWTCCYLILPSLIVWLADNAEVDGRSPHRWIVSVARYHRRPSRTLAGRALRDEGSRIVYRGKVKVWWDLNAPRLHHGRVRGGRVTSSVPVRFTHAIRHKHPVIRPTEGGDLVVDHAVIGQLEVRP